MRLIILCAFLGLSALAFAEQKGAQPARTGSNTQDQRGTAKLPLVIQIAPGERVQIETKTEASEAHEKARGEARLFWVTVWLALVTTVLAGFTGYLWYATRQLF